MDQEVGGVAEGLLALGAGVGLVHLVLLVVDPEAASVAESLVTLCALVRLAAGVGVTVLLEQLVIIESFATISAHKLVVPGVFALVVTQALGRGKAVTALVANEASFSVVESFMNILQMSGGEQFRALGAGELFLIIVFGRDMFQKRLLTLKFFGTMGAGECFTLEM